MVVEARRWVGRGHATQIGPPPVPICGPRDPRRRGKGEPMAVGKGKGRGRGWRLGRGLGFDVYERVLEREIRVFFCNLLLLFCHHCLVM